MFLLGHSGNMSDSVNLIFGCYDRNTHKRSARNLCGLTMEDMILASTIMYSAASRRGHIKFTWHHLFNVTPYQRPKGLTADFISYPRSCELDTVGQPKSRQHWPSYPRKWGCMYLMNYTNKPPPKTGESPLKLGWVRGGVGPGHRVGDIHYVSIFII